MKTWQWVVVGFIAALMLAGGGALVSTLPPGTVPAVVQTFANAIATAEGFFISGSRAARNNNPGNLKQSFGYSVSGNDGIFPIFSTVDDGWAALHDQVYKMFYGGSAYYNPGQTIAQVGWIYADGQHDPNGAQNWAANVASALNVTTDTTLQTFMS